MAFSGEFIDYHKHIGRLTLDGLRDAAKIAVASMKIKITEFEVWHSELNSFALTRSDAEALTFRAVEQGVLSPGKFGKFHELFFEKKNKENDAFYHDTLYGFHGAMTQLWNHNSLIGTAPRHEGLVKIMDDAKKDLTTVKMIQN